MADPSRLAVHAAEKRHGEIDLTNLLPPRIRKSTWVAPPPRPKVTMAEIRQVAEKRRRTAEIKREQAELPAKAYAHKVGWVGRLLFYDPGPNMDGLGPKTTAELKFEDWPANKKIHSTFVAQFFEKTESGEWVWPNDDRTRAAIRLRVLKFVTVQRVNNPTFPPLDMTPGDLPAQDWVLEHYPQFFAPDTMYLTPHAHWQAWVNAFRNIFGQATQRQFENKDSAGQRTIVVCEAMPIQSFLNLFFISHQPSFTLAEFVSPAAVYGPHSVVDCKLHCPPDRCNPGHGVHAGCARGEGWTLARMFYAAELCTFMTPSGAFLSDVWPRKKFWLNSTDIGELRIKDGVSLRYSVKLGKLTLKASYEQFDSAGFKMP
jgi:hypothetical protein